MDAIGPTTKKLHPLVAMAAVAVIVVSVLGAIVLITDQVAAHRAPDSASSATAGGTAAPSAGSAEAASTGGAEAASSAGAPPAHRRVAQAGSPPPPPAGAPPGVPPDVAMAPAPPPAVCASCGIVSGVRVVKTPGQGTGVGAVAGGVVGGLLGNQFGRGHGNTAMTVIGAIGGALGGNEVEKEAKATSRYEVDVRLDNGQMRTVSVPGDPGPIVGVRVRIDSSGRLIREAPQS